jgi:anti-sigma B factor antagonist
VSVGTGTFVRTANSERDDPELTRRCVGQSGALGWSGTVLTMSERSREVPAAEQILSISHRQAGEAIVVTVAGEVDVLTAPRLLAAVSEALEQAGGGLVVVDLSEVSFLGSAGLAALVDAALAAEGRHEPLRVVVDHTRPVIRPLEASGLDQVLRLHRSVEDALEPRADPLP